MDVLLNLDKFFAEHRGMGFKVPIAIILVFGILSGLISTVTLHTVAEEFMDAKEVKDLIMFFSVFTSIFAFVGAFISWLLLTVIFYAISAILGGKGSFSTLMKFLAFSFIPNIIMSPIYYYLLVEFIKLPTAENFYAFFILSGFVTLWQFVYWIFAVKNARELDLKKSIIVCVIPLVILFSYSLYSVNMQLESLRSLKELMIK